MGTEQQVRGCLRLTSMDGSMSLFERSEIAGSVLGSEKFTCPLDFIPFSPVSTSTEETLNRPSTELWLIKAPLDFNPESFKGQNIPLMGFKSLKIKKNGEKRFYNVFSTPREMEASHLIIPSPENGQLVCGPTFQGYMNICDSYGNGVSSMLHPIPDRPLLQIPKGLKQRFQPFGAMAPPKTVTKKSTDETVQELDELKTKKKKRRRKHENTGVEQQQVSVRLAAFTDNGLPGNPSDQDNSTEEDLYLAVEDQQDTYIALKKRRKKKREKERTNKFATALQMENNLEVESSPVAHEAVVLEIVENIIDKTDCPPQRKKKKKSIT